MKHILGLIGLIAGLMFGNEFPDIDQRTDLLLHRSIITHGAIIPLVIFAIASVTRSIPVRWFAMGLTLSVAIHLSFDLFPKGWSGFALISVPTYGWTAQSFSWTWIAASTVACTYMAVRLVSSVFDGSVLILSLIGGVAYISTGEDSFWRPIVALLVATVVTTLLVVSRAVSED